MQLPPKPLDFVAQNLNAFNRQFPRDGKSLTPTNWGAWQNSTTEPAKSGYVLALQKAGLPAQSFVIPPYVNTPPKFGYFTYPMDNTHGEFTNVPLNVHATLTLYPATATTK
jgi:hypothetical protein